MWWQNYAIVVSLSVILLGLIIVLGFEAITHRYRLRRIPIRVHVNGTRGKSSVTRLIAAGLRAGGIRTCAKTTGTLARFIYPDGHETPIYRAGHTNVIEQVAVIKRAYQEKAQALVIECMALQPLLQSLCELKLVRATHGVLTNARPDHLEVMGPLEQDVALALAGTVPARGQYFTTETKHLPILQYALKDRKSTLTHVSSQQIAAVTDEELKGFSYTEFKENIALALSVCESLGVKREVALQGMWDAQPDPGVLSTYTLHYQQQSFIFASAFAANDPVSTKTLWDNLREKHSDCTHRVLIVNCRSDRQERSVQLGEAINTWALPNAIIMAGTGTKTFRYYYQKYYGNKRHTVRLVQTEQWTAEEILTWIATHYKGSTLIVGIGNIAGIGLELIDYCRSHREKHIC